MIPRRFEYSKANTVSEALDLLDTYPESKVLAGGMSLIPVMKLRLASPPRLIDVNGIPELSYIKKSDGGLSLGALTRHYEITESDLVHSFLPSLSDAAEVIGDTQVRNMGTIGGSLTHADPAADYAGVALACDATLHVRGKEGTRIVPVLDFFVDTFTTSLKPNELVVEVRFPILPSSGSAYLKLERKSGDFATVGVAAFVQRDEKGSCKKAGIGLVSSGPTPIKALAAEKEMVGRDLNDSSVIGKAAEAAARRDANPYEDLKGDEEYKREMVRVFTIRALKQAILRIKTPCGGKRKWN